MLSVEKLIRERFPEFAAKPAMIRWPVIKLLQWLLILYGELTKLWVLL